MSAKENVDPTIVSNPGYELRLRNRNEQIHEPLDSDTTWRDDNSYVGQRSKSTKSLICCSDDGWGSRLGRIRMPGPSLHARKFATILDFLANMDQDIPAAGSSTYAFQVMRVLTVPDIENMDANRPNASFDVKDRWWYKVKELENETMFQQLFKNQADAIFENTKREEGPLRGTFICRKHPEVRFKIKLYIIDNDIETPALGERAQDETAGGAKKQEGK